MSRRTLPPFRADHVGSLLRTPDVLKARDDFSQGRVSAADKRRVEDDAIRAVVKMQEDLGLQGVTDGEYRRASWHMDFIYQIGGITKAQDNLKVQFHNEKGDIEFTPAAMRVTGKLTFDTAIFADDFTFLRSVAKGSPKLTIPSPSMVHYRGGRAAIDPGVYPDIEEYWHDLEQVYAKQVAALGSLGCRYLQLDDTSLAYLNDPSQREYVTGSAATASISTKPISAISTLPWPRNRPTCRFARTCAAEISSRHGWRLEATSMSPKRCSTNCRSTVSSSSTTMPGRVASSRCALCHRESSSSSAW